MHGLEDVKRDGIDPEWLFKVRVVVARHGEMDRAKWWNTNKALSTTGGLALKRGLPRTYMFAQARIVFTVARRRCEDHFDPPKSVTLWKMPEAVEETVEAAWEGWLDDAPAWAGFFGSIATPPETDLASLLSRLDLVHSDDVALARNLRRSQEGRSVLLPNMYTGTREDVALMALGFDRGTSGLAVPYARLADA